MFYPKGWPIKKFDLRFIVLQEFFISVGILAECFFLSRKYPSIRILISLAIVVSFIFIVILAFKSTNPVVKWLPVIVVFSFIVTSILDIIEKSIIGLEGLMHFIFSLFTTLFIITTVYQSHLTKREWEKRGLLKSKGSLPNSDNRTEEE